MNNDGKEYEKFVAALQQALLDAEPYVNQNNIKIELNKKILDNSGVKREFDLYWEYELGGLTYKTVIECKDYNSKISVEKIDALIGKVKDIPDLRTVFATNKGYQSGALKKAEHNKIDLLIIREQNDSDWEDSEGNSLLKEICINMQMITAPRIMSFEPLFDGVWIEHNTNIDISNPPKISGPHNEMFIEDVDEDNEYSIHDLPNRLKAMGNSEYGSFTTQKEFKNAFFKFKDIRWKLHSYKIVYIIAKPRDNILKIDFSKELFGVIEYLSKGKKKTFFNGGVIKENDI